MNLTQLEQFYIINYFEVDFYLIIYHLTYLTFLVNFYNQSSKSIFLINLYLISGTTGL